MDDSDDQEASSHTTGHMSDCMTGRVEIVGRVLGRRRLTVEQKLAILRDAFGPDGSVRSACEHHAVGSLRCRCHREDRRRLARLALG